MENIKVDFLDYSQMNVEDIIELQLRYTELKEDINYDMIIKTKQINTSLYVGDKHITRILKHDVMSIKKPNKQKKLFGISLECDNSRKWFSIVSHYTDDEYKDKYKSVTYFETNPTHKVLDLIQDREETRFTFICISEPFL